MSLKWHWGSYLTHIHTLTLTFTFLLPYYPSFTSLSFILIGFFIRLLARLQHQIVVELFIFVAYLSVSIFGLNFLPAVCLLTCQVCFVFCLVWSLGFGLIRTRTNHAKHSSISVIPFERWGYRGYRLRHRTWWANISRCLVNMWTTTAWK